MQQPELGKKIAHCRKIKGFTQEELVAKCNLSVRTLQRIENGKANPRTYTVKLIFAALELDFEGSFRATDINDKKSIKPSSEPFYNLFDLKALLFISSLLVYALIFVLFAITSDSGDKDKSDTVTSISNSREVFDITDLKLNEGDFSCVNCFYENEYLIGHGVKFRNNGVNVDVELIKLNINSGEFNAGFAKGILRDNKVEVRTDENWIDKKPIKFEAEDSVRITKDKLFLKGNAKLLSLQNQSITANEIIIPIE